MISNRTANKIDFHVEERSRLSFDSGIKHMLVVIGLLLISGCSTVGYITESALGHWSLVSKRQPINELLTHDSVPQSLKSRLRYAQQATDFAHRELLLPDNGSYADYVQLEQSFVSWAVFVAQPFDLQLHEWCFWLLGCVPYRGYFDRRDANAFARNWQSKGFDTYVVGVPAYSTLGWFSDPLISSMMAAGNLSTAAVIFHELAHQKIYVKNDAEFNESFAEAVQWIGLQRWVKKRNESSLFHEYLRREKIMSELRQLLFSYRKRLDENFKADKTNRLNVTSTKAQIYAQLYFDLDARKEQWLSHYGITMDWPEAELNNAVLLAFASYHRYKQQFIKAYEQVCSEDLVCFYALVEWLAELPAQQREVVMQRATFDGWQKDTAAQ